MKPFSNHGAKSNVYIFCMLGVKFSQSWWVYNFYPPNKTPRIYDARKWVYLLTKGIPPNGNARRKGESKLWMKLWSISSVCLPAVLLLSPQKWEGILQLHICVHICINTKIHTPYPWLRFRAAITLN